MNFISFKSSFRDFPIFSIADIRVTHGSFDRRRLSEWQKKGYIKKIIKGYYLFSDVDVDETTLMAIANKIYKPSYVSFETALSYYHLIPESIYLITSASSRRTSVFNTPMARFSFRTIKPALFFGYSLLPGGIKIAYMEKAILDYLYLNPAVGTEDDFEALRLNREELVGNINKERLKGYLRRYKHKRLTKIMKHFLGWLEHA